MTDCIIQLAKEHYDLPEVVFQQAAMKEFLTEAAKVNSKANSLWHLQLHDIRYL